MDKSSRSKFYFIFEFCDHDLAGILRNANVKFSLGHIKSIMQQLLDGKFNEIIFIKISFMIFLGLYFIHKNHIIHR